MNEADVIVSSLASTAILTSSTTRYSHTRSSTRSLRVQKVVSESTLEPLSSSNLKRSVDSSSFQDFGSVPLKRRRGTNAPSSKKPTNKLQPQFVAKGKLSPEANQFKASGAERPEPEVLRPLDDILADDLDSECRPSLNDQSLRARYLPFTYLHGSSILWYKVSIPDEGVPCSLQLRTPHRRSNSFVVF